MGEARGSRMGVFELIIGGGVPQKWVGGAPEEKIGNHLIWGRWGGYPTGALVLCCIIIVSVLYAVSQS